MSSKNELETQKLRAEINKLKAEKEKILAEKEKIEPTTKKKWYQSVLSCLSDNFLPLIAILSAFLTLLIGVQKFVDQQKEKQKFQITTEVISLVEKLWSEKKEDRKGAAILLSAYGEHALPLLMTSLKTEISEEFFDALNDSLIRIAENEPKTTIPKLIKQTEEIFNNVMGGDKKRTQPLLSHIRILGNLGKIAQSGEIINVLTRFHREMKCQNLNEQTNAIVSIVEKRAICGKLETACEKLGVTECKK